jgi:hypothetical protein
MPHKQFIIAIFEIINAPISRLENQPRYRPERTRQRERRSRRLTNCFNSGHSGLRKIGSPPGLDRLRLVLLLLLKPVVVPGLMRLCRTLWRATGAFASGWLVAEGAA